MVQNKKYYEAYDDRYRQVHDKSLKWFSDLPSEIVEKAMMKYNIGKAAKCLEIGCGEGRDAVYLLNKGYDLLATDISPAAISDCKKWYPEHANSFCVLDCLSQELNGRYDFIYAVAVLHMLVLDEDRARFFDFLRKHLSDGGVALVCTMGDGNDEWHTDIDNAFDLQKRRHEATGEELMLAATSCRIVGFSTLKNEIASRKLELLESGITAILPDFPATMYAVVKKQGA